MSNKQHYNGWDNYRKRPNLATCHSKFCYNCLWCPTWIGRYYGPRICHTWTSTEETQYCIIRSKLLHSRLSHSISGYFGHLGVFGSYRYKELYKTYDWTRKTTWTTRSKLILFTGVI